MVVGSYRGAVNSEERKRIESAVSILLWRCIINWLEADAKFVQFNETYTWSTFANIWSYEQVKLRLKLAAIYYYYLSNLYWARII